MSDTPKCDAISRKWKDDEPDQDAYWEAMLLAENLERENADLRAEADRLLDALRPKIIPSVGVAIGTRLRDFYRNRFALVNPVQHTDNERQVILAALESLLSALVATRKEEGNG